MRARPAHCCALGALLSLAIVACDGGGSPLDASTRVDASVCDGEPRVGCPCDEPGRVICRSPGPDLFCTGEVWGGSADGPCPGLDGGPRADAGSSSADDAGVEDDAGSEPDASADDAGTDGGASAAADAGAPDAGTPATATHCIDIDVSNTCDMTVTPREITIPAGQTAYFCWRNRSSDYPVDVWLSYGGGYTDLAPGATWNEPPGHCLGPTAHTEYADISTACSEFRFLIRCL